MRAPQVADFCAAAWQDFTPPLTNYYEFGGRFQALSQALDHATVGATLRYAGTTIQGDALSRQQKELAVKVMGKLITGDLRASGPIANELMRFQNRLRIRVMPPEQLLDWTIQRTERNDTMLYPMPWGYCAWSKTSGRYAQCLEKAQRKVGISRPDNKKRPCICGSGCKQFLRTPEFEGFWEHAGERHQQIIDNPAAPDRLVEAAREGVRIARQSERMETL
ncbi:hypothetical protein GA0004734_00001410 [Rhizobium sp. 9140]|nr:hypothetical protein GA0004734_00001410 [Rhizobium sp. 9140]